MDVDFSRSFFDQLNELISRVPKLALNNTNSVNSEYTNFATENKNCYLVISGWQNEDVLYSMRTNHLKDSMECYNVFESEQMYECLDCSKCYRISQSQDCQICTDGRYLFDCRNCDYCLGCAGLRNKTYHILNKPVSKAQYEETRDKLNTNPEFRDEFIATFSALLLRTPHLYGHMVKTEGSTGDYLFDSNRCFESFELRESEQCRYSVVGGKNTDLCDATYADEDELMYEIMSGHHGYGNMFCGTVWFSQWISYSLYCMNSNNLFGCDGVRKGSFCILNKQYSEHEYQSMVKKIKAHMSAMPYRDSAGRTYPFGEFMPSDLSPFAYNETVAQEMKQLSREEAIAAGYRWKASDSKQNDSAEDISHYSIADDSIIKKIFTCTHGGACKEQCTGVYKIVHQELKFYRVMNLPLPALCPNCRHYQRIAKRNPYHLWHRQCMCDHTEHGHRAEIAPELQQRRTEEGGRCPIEFETTYAPERPEQVFCESCYQKEIV
jgi:hypothetical protein